MGEVSMQVVRELPPADTQRPHSTRRIVVTKRDDGLFEWREQYWYRTEYEGQVISEGWATPGPEDGIYDTADMAEAAGRAIFANRYNLTSH